MDAIVVSRDGGVVSWPEDLPEDVRREIEEELRATARRDELRRERWGEGGYKGMTRLARSFPSLQDASGIEPWDAMVFARGAFGGWQTGGSVHAVRFVLQVWSRTDWRKVAVEEGWCSARSAKKEHHPLAPFNVVAALGSWDHKHVAAFLAWCEAPFFP
jgi:hypothetical protein